MYCAGAYSVEACSKQMFLKMNSVRVYVVWMQIRSNCIVCCCKVHKEKRGSAAAPPTESYMNCQQAVLPHGPFVNTQTHTLMYLYTCEDIH